MISPGKGAFKDSVTGPFIANTIKHNSVVFTRTVIEEGLYVKCYYSHGRSRWQVDVYKAGEGWATVCYSSTVVNNATGLLLPLDLTAWFVLANETEWEEDLRMKVSVLLDEDSIQPSPDPRHVTLINTCATEGNAPNDAALELLFQISFSEIHEDAGMFKSTLLKHLSWAVGHHSNTFSCCSILPSSELEVSGIFSVGIQIHAGQYIRSQLVSQLLKRDSPVFSLPLLQQRLVGVKLSDCIPSSQPDNLRMEADWLLRWDKPSSDGCGEFMCYVISGKLNGLVVPFAKTQVEAWLVPVGLRDRLSLVSVVSVNSAGSSNEAELSLN